MKLDEREKEEIGVKNAMDSMTAATITLNFPPLNLSPGLGGFLHRCKGEI